MASKIQVDKIARGSGTPEFTIPTADGTAGQFLKTDGSGVLAFDTVTTNPLALTGSTNNTIATVTGADALTGEANFTYDGNILDIKNAGTASSIKLYCESSNAHYQAIKAAPHAGSSDWTLTLPPTVPSVSGQALTATTAGVASWATVGGLKFISTTTNNAAVSTWDFTDVFTSTYSVYFMTFENIYLDTANQELRLSVGNSDLSSLENGAFVIWETYLGSGGTTYRASTGATYCDLCDTANTTIPVSGHCYFASPQDSTIRTTYYGVSRWYRNSNEHRMGEYMFYGDDAESHVSFRFSTSSGNLGSASNVARVTLYGLSES